MRITYINLHTVMLLVLLFKVHYLLRLGFVNFGFLHFLEFQFKGVITPQNIV